jgi:hypothetical protein
MPEVFRQGAMVVRVLLPPREHGPAHVHVWCPEGVAVVEVMPSVRVREIHGRMKAATLREIVDAISARHDECVAAWRRHHG